MELDFAIIAKKYFTTLKALFYITLFGAGLRLLGLFEEFWIDEVWSFFMVSQLKSPLEIITKVFYTNNHILNSFFMYFIGKGNPNYWFKFRLLSFFSGVLIIPLVYLISKSIFAGRAWRFIACGLVAASFPLIISSSEARGYAPAALFGLLSFYTLSEFLHRNNIWFLLAFYYSFVLGFLSHLSFLYASFGLFGISIYFQLRQQSLFRHKISVLLKIFVIPFVLVTAIYLRFVLHLRYGGADIAPLTQTLKELATYLVGFPSDNRYSYIISIIVCILLIKEIFNLLREGSLLGVFFISSATGICLDILLRRPLYFYFRYSFPFYPLLIILLSHSLYRFRDKYKKLRIVPVALILLILFGNMVSYSKFLKWGRGHYLEALDYMRQNSRSTPISVASDHDFRNPLLLEFYRLLRPDTKIIYMPEKFEPPEWFIKYIRIKNTDSSRSIEVQGVIYGFIKAYFAYDGSGWLLYHRKPFN